jgi:hypothetical protein
MSLVTHAYLELYDSDRPISALSYTVVGDDIIATFRESEVDIHDLLCAAEVCVGQQKLVGLTIRSIQMSDCDEYITVKLKGRWI